MSGRVFDLWATINSVYDGDTMYADLDLGIGVWNKGLAKSGMGLRLWGCNARELHDFGGAEAQANLAELFPVGSVIKVTSRSWDKWSGRIDVSHVLPDGRDLVTMLIEQQWAAGPYFGTGPKPVPPWPRTVA